MEYTRKNLNKVLDKCIDGCSGDYKENVLHVF